MASNSSADQGSRSEGANGWADLEVSFKTTGYVPYRSYHIYIYQSLDVERPGADKSRLQYFYTPVLLLEPTTAKYQCLTLKRKHVVSFEVTMWNEEVENIVLDYMGNQLGMKVERAQVKPIPFEKLMLTLSASIDADVCQCPNEWVSYQMHKVKTFHLICSSKEGAEEVAEAMREDPKQFEDVFEMKLKLSTRQTGRRETMINMEDALEGEFFSKLVQKLPNENEALLTAEDTSRLLNEATKRVVIRAYSENLDMSSENEAEIYALLQKMMVDGKETIDDQSEKKLWDSVFWNEDNYRPDRIASELNESFKKCDNETQKAIKHVVDQAASGGMINQIGSMLKDVASLGNVGNNKKSSKSAVGILFASFQKLTSFVQPFCGLGSLLGCIFSLSSKSDKKDVEERVRAFVETMSKLEWKGDKFVPRPMTLTRINLAKVRNRQSLEDVKLTVSRSSGVFTMAVNINFDAESRNCGYYEDLSARLRRVEDALAPKKRIGFFVHIRNETATGGKFKLSGEESQSIGWTIDWEGGIVTVPRDGYYTLFFVSGSKDEVIACNGYAAFMMCNAEEIFANRMETRQPFSLTAVQRLSKGDKLSVVRNPNRNLLPFSVFAGCSID